MRTRALMPGVLWNVRDTNPPTQRKPPKAKRGRKASAESLQRAGHVLWLHEQRGTYREIADLTGYGYAFVHRVLSKGAYLRAVPTPWPPKFEEAA